MSKKKIALFFILVIIIALGYFIKTNPEARGFINKKINKLQGKTLDEKFEVKIKSGNLSTDYNIEQVLRDIDKFKLNTLNIPIVINIDNLSSSDMTVDEGSIKRAKSLMKKLRGKHINIILEPYPWIDNGSKYETDWKPDNIDAFFWNWKTKVLRVLIDEVAVPYHVDALNIGSSFVHMEYAEGYWCDTIDYVRQYYKGLVTYRTGWWYTAHWKPETIVDYEKKLNNKLFSKLDFISIAAYFELTDRDTNTIEALASSIGSSEIYDRKQNIKQEIKNFHDKWGKPIFFGELGFPKTNSASVHPWNPYQNDVVNNIEQANCFEAYRRNFEKEQWFLGFSIFAIGETSSDKRYYPSEESTAVIRNWYKPKE